ncbi:18265_t:CDS:2, partial [Racocetra persica]
IHAYREPLAELWEADETELSRLLNIEKNLIMIDEIIRPLLDNLSFGGTSVNVILSKLVIYTVDFSKARSLRSLPEHRKHNKAFLEAVAPLKPEIIFGSNEQGGPNLQKRAKAKIIPRILLGERIHNQNHSCALDARLISGHKIRHEFMTDIISIKGDSGAPIFSYLPDLSTVSIHGILSGGFDEMTNVAPINEFLE